MRDIFSSLRDFGPVLLCLSMTGMKKDRYNIAGSKLSVTEVIDFLGHVSHTSQLIHLNAVIKYKLMPKNKRCRSLSRWQPHPQPKKHTNNYMI